MARKLAEGEKKAGNGLLLRGTAEWGEALEAGAKQMGLTSKAALVDFALTELFKRHKLGELPPRLGG